MRGKTTWKKRMNNTEKEIIENNLEKRKKEAELMEVKV